MKSAKHTIDYELNMQELREFEEQAPMTLRERAEIRKWVKRGYTIDSNPWHEMDFDDQEMNFLQAYRIHNGYKEGYWDYWKGLPFEYEEYQSSKNWYS